MTQASNTGMVTAMRGLGLPLDYQIEEGTLVIGPGRDGWSGLDWLLLYSAVIKNFLEGYWVAARVLSELVMSSTFEQLVTPRASNEASIFWRASAIAGKACAIVELMICAAFTKFTSGGNETIAA